MRISDWSSDVCSSDLECEGTSGAVSGHPKHNNGRWNIADPRDVPMDAEFAALPDPKDRLVCRIIATDNTWHRPFTTLDLASLQALFDPVEAFGRSEEDGVGQEVVSTCGSRGSPNR